MRFSRDTALDRAGDGWTGSIVSGWDILGNANGGYLMAILGRAAALSSGRPDVVTLSAEFHSPGRAGAIRVTTQEVRTGRRFSSTRVDLGTEDRLVLTGTVQTGDLSSFEGPTLKLGAPRQIPPPDECVSVEPTDTFPPPFVGQIDSRVHPDDVPFSGNGASQLIMRSWFRLRDREPMDTLAAVMACDASPPTVFNSPLEIGWTPTVQMTVHVRRRPATEWLFIDTSSRFVSDGTVEVDCDLWDQTGELVAQSRQFALTPISD